MMVIDDADDRFIADDDAFRMAHQDPGSAQGMVDMKPYRNPTLLTVSYVNSLEDFSEEYLRCLHKGSWRLCWVRILIVHCRFG